MYGIEKQLEPRLMEPRGLLSYATLRGQATHCLCAMYHITGCHFEVELHRLCVGILSRIARAITLVREPRYFKCMPLWPS